MGSNYNSGRVTADISGSVNSISALPVPATATQTPWVIGNGKAGTSWTSGTGGQLRTVTAGKRCFVTSMSWANMGTNINMQLRDSTTVGGGSAIGAWSQAAAATNTWVFPPGTLEITAGLFVDVSGAQAQGYIITGYEVTA